MYKISLLLATIAMCSVKIFAQQDSSKTISVTAFADFYYSSSSVNNTLNEKEYFLYNHKRLNEVAANIVLAKIGYNNKNTRANLAVMTGNYAQYNLATEPTILQNIYEANVGIKISNHKNIWVDVGIMPSHVGFESAISADCYTPTRSIVAENSPYYEAGAKLTTTNKTETFTYSFLILNGWQKIQKPNHIKNPSLGMQFTYKPKPSLLINYSNFLGTDKPDSLHAIRTYHNFYIQNTVNDKLSYIVGFDLGTDKYNANDYGFWCAPITIVKYNFNAKNAIACRAEYFNDANETAIQTNLGKGFKVFNFSSNYDYNINNNCLWRIEAKLFTASENIFDNSNNNFCITTNLSFKL